MAELDSVEVINAYAEALIGTEHIFAPESALPCDKDSLGVILLHALDSATDEDERSVLSEAYLRLEAFLSEESYELLSKYLEMLGTLNESDDEITVLISKAAELVPTTSHEVMHIFEAIDQGLASRRTALEEHGIS